MISWYAMLTFVMVAALTAFLIIILLAMKKVSGHPIEPLAEPLPRTEGMLLEWLAPVYDRYCPWIGLGRAFRLMTLARAGLKPDERVLDVGCGTGVLTRLAAEAVGPAGRVIGIDPGPKMIGIARKNAGIKKSRADFRLAAIEALPFDDGSFDCVLSSFMMHHLPPETKRKGLREVYRVLRPGGRMLIVDIGRPANPLWWILVWPLLFWRYTVDQVAGRLDAYLLHAGFTSVDIVAHWKGLMSFYLAYKGADV